MQDSIVNPETIRDVDVCACTFRRASVVDLLRSLAKLVTPGWRMRVIIADNDDQPSARETVERAFAALGLNGLLCGTASRRDDSRPGRPEHQRDRLADAAPCACDDGHLACEYLL